MTGSRLMHWILCCFAAAIAFAGCTSDGTSSESTGGLNLNLELAEGIVINEVDWTLSSPGMEDMTGTIDTSAPGATASVEVFGLPPGDEYLVELEATDETGEITCRGDAPFEVEIGVATDVMVFLNCKLPARLGGVRVNGKFNVCADLAKVVVSSLQTSVGNDIDLSAIAADVEGDSVAYVWSATGGSIADSNAQQTTYTCGEVGQQSITITVSDDAFEYCMDDWTVAVTCVEGEGDLCEGVTCEDTGNECTVAECNPANGECETSTADDGTECNSGAGMCMDGECVDENLCDGVDCDDQNECTADLCNPEDGSCSSTPVDDGTSCNGGAGMCVGGTCMDTNLCDGVTCDDTGNECTVAQCNNQNGECETMNVPDGTECNGGAGACSAGVCVDDNLCDGVDCSSSNDCVQDGTCDPADGQCIAGDNEPADTACAGGVCDGAGACVECNSAGQCPDDGNACTAAACEGNQCAQNAVMDGTACSFMGGDGICEAGTCVAAPGCISPGDCDDSNVCTTDDCVDGECAYVPNDGASCDAGGLPGTCAAGACVGLCNGVECPAASQCIQDGSCDDQSGACVPGANEPIDTACTEGGGSVCNGAGACVECNSDGQCPGAEVCTGNVCMPGTIDPSPQDKTLSLGCTNSVTADISILNWNLLVDPGPIVGGETVFIDVTGTAAFSEVFLDAAQQLVSGGVSRAQLFGVAATLLPRAGLSGPDAAAGVTLGPGDIPFTCEQDVVCDLINFPSCTDCFATPGQCVPKLCDPANVNPGPTGGNLDCTYNTIPIFTDDCKQFVALPTSSDCAAGGLCESLTDQFVDPPDNKKNTQCDFSLSGGAPNGFCVTGPVEIPLSTAIGEFVADPSGVVLLGWDDANTGATLNPDGTWQLVGKAFAAPPAPNGIRVGAGGLPVAVDCTMAVDSADPEYGVAVPDKSSPTPDELLIQYMIQ